MTGASSGIGFELAKVFAAEGFNLLIAAENGGLTSALMTLQEEGAGVEAHRVDLASEAGVIEPYRHIQNTGRPVDALALGAGIGLEGSFATRTKLSDELKLIDLNVRGTVHLCKLVAADMVERDSGRILFTSSIGGPIPGAYQAVHNASEFFVQSFALALRDELQDTGISVTTLTPGTTETEVDRASFSPVRAG